MLSCHLPGLYEGFEGLQAEECGILNGCENGRCVRVREGYTCDCFDGFQLDMTRMACVGEWRRGPGRGLPPGLCGQPGPASLGRCRSLPVLAGTAAGGVPALPGASVPQSWEDRSEVQPLAANRSIERSS